MKQPTPCSRFYAANDKPSSLRIVRTLASILTLALAPCAISSVHADVQVRTTSGEVIGLQATGMQVFRSIPYAKPPTGKLRFRRAVPVKPWSKPRTALAPGPACLQIIDRDDPAEDGDAIQSEDCLTLNVWTPDSKAGRRPVMVFIHGGGFEEGSAADSWYDGATLARAGDVVVVTVQYRLGVLGFLDLSAIGGAAFAGSGNNGLTDQVLALHWVQQNIANFGGDPKNVTIFGESAGGASVRALMALSEARDLFHKAIVESGTGHFLTQQRAAEICREFAKIVGAKSAAELQRLSPEALMRAQDAFFSAGYGSMPFGIVADGVLFNRGPLEMLAADPSLSKPLLIGTNAEEMRYWVAMDANGVDRQPHQPLHDRLHRTFGSEVGDPLAVYLRDSESSEEAISTLLGDAIFRLPSIRLAELNATRQPTYMYLFTYRSLTRGRTGLEYGAMHGLEVARPLTGSPVGDDEAKRRRWR